MTSTGDPRRDVEDEQLTASMAEEDDDTPKRTAPGRSSVTDDADQEASPTGTIGNSDYPLGGLGSK